MIYNETMIAGVLVDGAAIDFKTKLRDDGCWCGVGYTESPEGGIAASGSAEVTDNIFLPEGGIVVGGGAAVVNLMDPFDNVEMFLLLDETADGSPAEYVDQTRHNYDGTGKGTIPDNEPGIYCLPSQGFSGQDWIELPPDSIAGPFSVTVWVNMLGWGEQRSFYSRGYSDGTNEWVFNLARTVAAHPWGMFNSEDGEEYVFGDMVDLNRWHHIGVTWSGQTAKLYVDGELEGETDLDNPELVPLVNSVYIGRFRQSGSPTCNMQVLRLYPEVKSRAWMKAERDNFCDRGFYYVEKRYTATTG